MWFAETYLQHSLWHLWTTYMDNIQRKKTKKNFKVEFSLSLWDHEDHDFVGDNISMQNDCVNYLW